MSKRRTGLLGMAVSVLLIVTSGTASAGTKKEDLPKGTTCELVSVNFWECKTPDGTIWWCDRTGNCEKKPWSEQETADTTGGTTGTAEQPSGSSSNNTEGTSTTGTAEQSGTETTSTSTSEPAQEDSTGTTYGSSWESTSYDDGSSYEEPAPRPRTYNYYD